MAEPDAAGLQAADPAGRGPDRRGLSGRDQHPAGAPRPGDAVRRGGRQGHGEPGLAQVPALAKAGVQSDWEAWQKRDLAHDDIVRVILDGTVVKVRLDKRSTGISVLVALGVRRDGQKVLLGLRTMGGESEAAWRAFLDDLVARKLALPDLLIHRRRRRPGGRPERAVADGAGAKMYRSQT